MMILVIGPPESGKSFKAENLAVEASRGGRLYYLATMRVMDDAGEERVRHHRCQREGKGFHTIEREKNLASVTDYIEDPADSTVLLECAANLTGNEMHASPESLALSMRDPAHFADRVADEVCALDRQVGQLIVVGTVYSTDDKFYDEETTAYMNLNNLVNERLRSLADRVVCVE